MEKIISGEECYKKKIIEWAQQQSDEKLMKLISLQDRLLSQQLSRKALILSSSILTRFSTNLFKRVVH